MMHVSRDLPLDVFYFVSFQDIPKEEVLISLLHCISYYALIL